VAIEVASGDDKESIISTLARALVRIALLLPRPLLTLLLPLFCLFPCRSVSKNNVISPTKEELSN
jgi:hypothetical protein